MLRLNVDLKSIMGKGTMLEHDDDDDREKSFAPRPRDELEEPAIVITNMAPKAVPPSTVVLPSMPTNNNHNHSGRQKSPAHSVKKATKRTSNALQEHLQAQPAPNNVRLQLFDVSDNSAIYNYNTIPSVYHPKQQELVSSIIAKTSPGKGNVVQSSNPANSSPTQHNANNSSTTNNGANSNSSSTKVPIPIVPTSYSPNERVPRPKPIQKPGSPPVAKELNFESLVLTNSSKIKPVSAVVESSNNKKATVTLKKIDIYPEKKEAAVDPSISNSSTEAVEEATQPEPAASSPLTTQPNSLPTAVEEEEESPTTISTPPVEDAGKEKEKEHNVASSTEKLMLPTSVYDFDSNFDSVMKPTAPSSSLPSKKLSKYPSPRQKNGYTFRYKSNKEKMLFIQSVYGNGMPLNMMQNATNNAQQQGLVSKQNKSPPRGNELSAGEAVYDTHHHNHHHDSLQTFSDELSDHERAVHDLEMDDSRQEVRAARHSSPGRASRGPAQNHSPTNNNSQPKVKPVGTFEAMLPTIDIIQLRASMQANAIAVAASNHNPAGSGGILYHPSAMQYDLSKHQNVHNMPSVVITNYQQPTATQRVVTEGVSYHPDFDGNPSEMMIMEPQLDVSVTSEPDPYLHIKSKPDSSMASSAQGMPYNERGLNVTFEDEDELDGNYSFAPASHEFQQPSPTQPHYQQLYQNTKSKGASLDYPTSNSSWVSTNPQVQSTAQQLSDSSPAMTHKQLNKLSRETKALKQQQQQESNVGSGLVIVSNADSVKRVSMSPRSSMKEQISQYKKRLTNSTSHVNSSPPVKSKQGSVVSTTASVDNVGAEASVALAPIPATLQATTEQPGPSLASQRHESAGIIHPLDATINYNQRVDFVEEEEDDHGIPLAPRSSQKQRTPISSANSKPSTPRKNAHGHHTQPTPPAQASHPRKQQKKVIKDDGDERGVYYGDVGDVIDHKYEIVYLLGQGVFGSVYQCRPVAAVNPHGEAVLKDKVAETQGKEVAVKVTHRHELFHKQARRELQILSLLRDAKSTNGTALYGSAEHVVDFLGSFQFQGHYAFVFPVYDLNLFEYLRSLDFTPIAAEETSHIAAQLFSALAYIHALGIIHADIKPENILLRHPNANQKVDIVVVDFGSAVFMDAATSTTPTRTSNNIPYIQSRFYRAPEVICGLGHYTKQIDVWSAACVLAECLIGTPLFIGEDNVDQLAVIAEVLGPIPAAWQQQYISPESVANTTGGGGGVIRSSDNAHHDGIPEIQGMEVTRSEEELQLSLSSTMEGTAIPPQHQVSLLETHAPPTAEQQHPDAEAVEEMGMAEDAVLFTCYNWVPTFSLPRCCTSHILTQSSTLSNRRSIVVTKTMSVDAGDADQEGNGLVPTTSMVRDYNNRNLKAVIASSQKWASRSEIDECVDFIQKCLVYQPEERLHTIPPLLSASKQGYFLASDHSFLNANTTIHGTK